MSELWVFGRRGVIVEHDPETRKPLEGGTVIRAVACQFHMDSTVEVVADYGIPGTAERRFSRNGWIEAAEGSNADGRWRLMTLEQAEQAGVDVP